MTDITEKWPFSYLNDLKYSSHLLVDISSNIQLNNKEINRKVSSPLQDLINQY